MSGENGRTLPDIFKKIAEKLSGTRREIFFGATNCRLKIDKERRIAEISCELPRLYFKKDLYALEEEIRSAYDLSQVRILPNYDPSLFTLDYLGEVLVEAGRVGVVCNGFFDRYELEMNDRDLKFKIPFATGGIEFLDLARTSRVIEGILMSEFGVPFTVSIVQSDRGEEEEAAFLARQLSELNSASDQIIKEQIAREAAEAQAAGPEKPEEPALPRVESLFEGSREALEIEPNVFQSGRIVFDCTAPEVVFGEAFEIANVKPLRTIGSTAKDVVILGEVFSIAQRETRRGDKVIFTVAVTDRDASLYVKVTVAAEAAAETEALFSKGKCYAFRGRIRTDSYDSDLYMQYTDVLRVAKRTREDNSPEKRVELHLHTVMSAMDATNKADDIVRTAAAWGHRAVAITDHGDLQSFPVAMLAADDLEKAGRDFKVIYGIEAYYVNDKARAAHLGDDVTFDDEFVVFDIETTGLSATDNRITEIGAVRFQKGEVGETFNSLVNPGIPIPEEITRLTGITNEMVREAPPVSDVLKAFFDFAGDRMLVAHNAAFDTGFIRQAALESGLPFGNPYLDTVAVSRFLNPGLKNHKLDTLADYYGLGDFNHHRASDDAEMLARIFHCMVERLKEDGIDNIRRMNLVMAEKADPLKLHPYHMIILAQNQTGLKNLYKLVSDSYLKYYSRYPRIPRSKLEELREGLLIGSACAAGEIVSAILEGKAEDELVEMARFYDYLEVQPLSNNEYLIREKRAADEESLRDLNRRIVELGKKAGRPVCATGDAHYRDPEDEIYRRIILTGLGYRDADQITKLYFRTTEEMLEEFSYLGEEVAREIVITNPNGIADRIGKVRPIPKGNYPPYIEGAEEELTTRCWTTAREMYGDPLPEIVSSRLQRELDSIINNGFAIMYVIARKLVKNSEEKGYQVGSRGSVGSSFAATMAGITRVNPLPPHYRCPICKWTEFFEGGTVGSGFDLPPKTCPVCGTRCDQDGHDIPFETFLGFKGDKTPDIDLNFSGDVQGAAHKFTEVLFGAGKAFKAGTIGTLADKTAYGFTAKFLEEKGISVNRAETDRLVNGCLGIKRTTGQHPGGVIIVPREYEIYDFSPVQHPAEDANSDIITTHFEFKYLHDTILKLDILGHDIPTKYKRLEEYTGIPVTDVPLSDPLVYEAFTSTGPIGVRPEQIDSLTSTLGMPELGTQFIRGVLIKAQPKTFADLLQIQGLTHGTGCWLGNAEELIDQKICTISEVIGCRDDIMMTLIHKYNIEKSAAFKIMEFVRKNKKGQIIPKDMQETMRSAGVPQWYVDSLQKIRYMFPKAHAAAYCIDALRLMWYKIYHPVEFYAAFFTAAPDGFDGEIVMGGPVSVRNTLAELKRRGKEISATEADLSGALMLVNEYFERGFTFLPVDIRLSHATKFLPENGKIRLPFTSLPGLGTSVAESLMTAMESGDVFSVEDLKARTKVSKSTLEILEKNGALDSLSKTNQMSMFS